MSARTRPAALRLAEPLPVGPVTLRNRLVWPAHLTNAARDGLPTAQHAAYYGARAAGGVAMIVTEEHSADPDDRPYERMIRGTDPAIVPGLRAITDAVHAHGAVVLAQVGHNGGQASSLYGRAPLLAPSPLPDPMFREVPRAMDDADVARLLDGFRRVAGHCVAGGYDGIEVQASQASLLRQFLSPLTNHRTDGHGTDRTRLLRAVLGAVREVLGPGRVLGVRIQGDEGLPGGLTAADAAAAARTVAEHVDYVSTAIGVATATLPLVEPPMGVPAGYAAAIPTAVRAAVDVPVLGVGRYTTPEQAEAALAGGSCDLVGVVRGQIADPDFARRALAGAPVRRCIGCNQECIAAVGLNRRLGCVVNPAAGREARALPAPVVRAARRRRVLVAGGGPAGLAAAAAAVARGDDVHLVEAAHRLGGQVAWASTAPGRGELAHLVEDLVRGLGAARVTCGVAVDAALVAARAPDLVVDATGSEPVPPAWAAPSDGTAPGGGPVVTDVEDVLTGRVATTGRVVVVDGCGGPAAPSTAELLARRGAAVTVLTAAMVPAADLGPTLEWERWLRRAAALGIATATDRVVLGWSEGALEVLHHPLGVVETWPVDAVVSAGPRRSRGLALPGAVVRPVGDAVAPRRLDAAVREGTDAVAGHPPEPRS